MPQFAGSLVNSHFFLLEYQKYYLDGEENNQHMPLGVIGFIPRYENIACPC